MPCERCNWAFRGFLCGGVSLIILRRDVGAPTALARLRMTMPGQEGRQLRCKKSLRKRKGDAVDERRGGGGCRDQEAILTPDPKVYVFNAAGWGAVGYWWYHAEIKQ